MDQSAGFFFSKEVISGYSSPNHIADLEHQQQGGLKAVNLTALGRFKGIFHSKSKMLSLLLNLILLWKYMPLFFSWNKKKKKRKKKKKILDQIFGSPFTIHLHWR